MSSIPAPGTRVLIRDEEWVIRNVTSSSVGQQIECDGISETVRHQEGVFLACLDNVQVLDPRETRLIPDTSPEFLAALLSLEARLRQTVPTGDRLSIGHKAAMDPLPFQLDPALRGLRQARPRLLIADAVGLGKTLEAGILVSELARRGRARRILVVTTRSMMRQFQQEFWTRFTIPLTRLDSAGIQRIRRRIPANHNPFHFYDKTIISVDTLKRDGQYRNYLENAWWDIILIDEAHNVSWKGNRTQSHRLATLLSQRSDALILLTATPHNGKKESFASLATMLDPTVLPPKAEYTREDVEHLFVRRFKRDVRDQIHTEFPDRVVHRVRANATDAEETAFRMVTSLRLEADEEQRSGAMLFRTTLEKALFSSPAACLQTIRERIQRLRRKKQDHPDIAALESLHAAVAAIDPRRFSKFQQLVDVLQRDRALRWDGEDPSDRLIIFTERIETLKFLKQHLPPAMGLKAEAVASLTGQMADRDIQELVEDFGKTNSPLRLLIATDVASEGINLHFQSHRLIHFDIPWSLMVFQQRNGRVDRYGQTRQPQIAYLLTESTNADIRGDMRILEVLISKDEEAARNIGDPSSFMGLYEEELEEQRVAQAMEGGETAEQFAADLTPDPLDWFEALVRGGEAGHAGGEAETTTQAMPSLFPDEFEYVRRGMERLRQTGDFQLPLQADTQRRQIVFQPDKDLDNVLARILPPEMRPADGQFALSTNPADIQNAIKAARDTQEWPSLQYLWPLHPIVQWLDLKMLSLFGRQSAPVIRVRKGLGAGESLVLVLAQIPNRRGQPILNEWFGVKQRADGHVTDSLSFETVVEATGIGRDELPNDGRLTVDDGFGRRLGPALDHVAESMKARFRAFDKDMKARLAEELNALAGLKERHDRQLQLDLRELQASRAAQRRRQSEAGSMNELFEQYKDWIHKTLELDERAQMTVAAVLVP